MIVKYYFRSLVTNKFLWFWGGFFCFMWAVLGAFVMDKSFLTPLTAMPITSSWYALLALISFSSVSVTLAISIAWSTNALIFSFKYTKLSSTRYLIDMLIAWVFVSLFLVIIGIIFTASMFYISSKVDVFPTYLSFLKTFGIAILVSVFFMLIAVLLVLLVISYSNVKIIQFLSFIPMILVFSLSYLMIYYSPPKLLIYLSPWNSGPSLIQASFANQHPINSFPSSHPENLSWPILLISLLLWEIILFAIDIYIFGRIKPQDIEAMRQL